MKKILLVIMLFGAVGLASAQSDENATILLQGRVMGLDAEPVVGAVVEIWQTDVNGNYMHPDDADPTELLPDFQYFGTTVTDENGFYAFRTVVPGEYEPRPAHIHLKVKIDGEEALTSQFYFVQDRPDAPPDSILVDRAGREVVFLEPVEQVDTEGNTVRVATGNIVLAIGEGTLIPTSIQQEGPYYPVVDFSDYDNNLTSTAEDDAPVLPILVECGPKRDAECEPG